MAGAKRLYDTFKPNSYQLDLSLNQASRCFEGKLTLDGIKRGRPSSRITLHQSNLKIDSAKLFKLDKKSAETELEVTRIVHQNKLQEVRLHSSRQLGSGQYRIELSYKGKIVEEQTSGAYLSTWHDDSDNLHELTATQFQPHYARSLLPCIDEPEAKASFDLTLKTPTSEKGYQAYSNMPLESSEEKAGIIIRKFQTSPLMSSYLFAFVYGELAQTSSKTSRGVQVSVITTPNKNEHSTFSLDFATKVIDFLENYFSVEYPLQKCDLVAVPDFDAGGMENWGLITFREDLLLFNEEVSTLADKQAIALVVAHEIAHQWFGNLVTMKWWDELWLNEGFANFMEFMIVDHFFPEWNIFEEYLVSEKSAAMRLDSLPSSKAIVKKVTTSSQTTQAFDEIAYEKSGSLIRMLYKLIGSQNFQEGLKDYFKKYQYSNATSSDLLKAWQKYTKVNLLGFAKSWLYQPGFPVLDIKLVKDNKGDLFQLKFSQQRFLSENPTKLNLEKEAKKALSTKPNLKKHQREFYKNQQIGLYKKEASESRQALWQVPVDFVGPLDTPQFVLKKQQHTVQLKNGQSLPLKLNKGGNGLYLVNYPVEFIAQIVNAIRQNKLPEVEIISLLSDFIILSRSSKLGVGSAAILDILEMSKSSLNPHFWSLAGSFLGIVNQHLKEEGQQELICPYAAKLIGPALGKMGFEFKRSDSDKQTAMRFELLSIGLMARQTKVLETLQSFYDQAGKEAQKLHPESRILTLFAVAKRGNKDDFNRLLEEYKTYHEDVSLREDIAYALCSFEGASFQNQLISLLEKGDYIRNQDILSWLSNLLYASKASKLKLLEWLQSKESGWNWLRQTLSPFDLSSAVRIFCSSSYTLKERNKLVRFFEKEEEHDLVKPIQEATEMAKARIKWHKQELPGVREYLDNC